MPLFKRMIRESDKLTKTAVNEGYERDTDFVYKAEVRSISQCIGAPFFIGIKRSPSGLSTDGTLASFYYWIVGGGGSIQIVKSTEAAELVKQYRADDFSLKTDGMTPEEKKAAYKEIDAKYEAMWEVIFQKYVNQVKSLIR